MSFAGNGGTSFEDRYTVSHGYKSVKRWTKKADLFAKEYILVPICQDQHWTLAIICRPYLVEKVMNEHIAKCKQSLLQPKPQLLANPLFVAPSASKP